MNKYEKTMARMEMPTECERRIRDRMAEGKVCRSYPAGRKILRLTVAAAAAVLLLIGGKMAAGGEWSDLVDLFRARNGGNYTESQIAQLTELEENIGLSAESGGITVTVDSVLTTENTADILLAVQGPELELQEGGSYSFYNFKYDMASDASQYFGLGPQNVRCECVGVAEDIAWVLFHYEQSVDPNKTLQSGAYVLTLALEDFYEYGASRGEEKVRYGGEWVFDLPLKEISEEKVVILRDVELMGWHREDQTTAREERLCLVDEVVIGARSVILRYHREDPLDDVHFDIQAVMRDGSVVYADIGGGHGVIGEYTAGMRWTQIIEPQEVDHLVVGGTVVPLPDEP